MTEVSLKPGWLEDDVKKAAQRVDEWTGTSRVEDTPEVERIIGLLLSGSLAYPAGHEKAADLIRRLAAAKVSAERERDEARRSAWAMSGTSGKFEQFEPMRQRALSAEAKLTTARADALEEAAKAVGALIYPGRPLDQEFFRGWSAGLKASTSAIRALAQLTEKIT